MCAVGCKLIATFTLDIAIVVQASRVAADLPMFFAKLPPCECLGYGELMF